MHESLQISCAGAMSNKTKIKAVLPKLMVGVSKVFEETLLEGLADSPQSMSQGNRVTPLNVNRGKLEINHFVVG